MYMAVDMCWHCTSWRMYSCKALWRHQRGEHGVQAPNSPVPPLEKDWHVWGLHSVYKGARGNCTHLLLVL